MISPLSATIQRMLLLMAGVHRALCSLAAAADLVAVAAGLSFADGPKRVVA